MAGEEQVRANELPDAANAVAAAYDADVLFYSGPINAEGFARLLGIAMTAQRRTNCLLVLTTQGGSLSSAYALTRYLHRHYTNLLVCVPAFCRSAGMLTVLGAHKLIIDEFSELAPLDGSATASLSGRDPLASTTAFLNFLNERAADLIEAVLHALISAGEGRLTPDRAAQVSISAAGHLIEACCRRL